MPKPIEKDIVVIGQLIHYYHVEPDVAKKNVIVFLHGWGSNSPLWFSSTLKLAEYGFELYFLDLPGFGKSASPLHPFFLENYAEIVAGFMKKLELVRPFLVGHSFGGKTGVRIAAKKMTQLSGLVLVDSSGLPHTSFATQAKIGFAKTVKPLMNLSFMQGIRSGLLHLSGSDDYIAFPELRETFVNIIREHVQDELPEISTPSLIIWGDRDDNSYTPLRDAPVFRSTIPVAEMEIIKNAGHYCFLDQPTVFFNVLLRFVEKIHGKN